MLVRNNLIFKDIKKCVGSKVVENGEAYKFVYKKYC